MSTVVRSSSAGDEVSAYFTSTATRDEILDHYLPAIGAITGRSVSFYGCGPADPMDRLCVIEGEGSGFTITVYKDWLGGTVTGVDVVVKRSTQ